MSEHKPTIKVVAAAFNSEGKPELVRLVADNNWGDYDDFERDIFETVEAAGYKSTAPYFYIDETDMQRVKFHALWNIAFQLPAARTP